MDVFRPSSLFQVSAKMLTQSLFLSVVPLLEMSPPLNIKIIFDYLCRDPGAHHSAKFSLYAGCGAEGVERPVHRAVLAALTPLVLQNPELDAIIIPDGTDDTLIELINYLYSGR